MGNWQQAVTDAVHESMMILYFDSEAARKSLRLVKELQEAKDSGLLILTFELENATHPAGNRCRRGVLHFADFPEFSRFFQTEASPNRHETPDRYFIVDTNLLKLSTLSR